MNDTFCKAIEGVPPNTPLSEIPKGVLAAGKTLKIIRLVVSAGEQIAEHKAGGEIAVVCLVGHVHFVIGRDMQHLGAGSLICLSEGQLHSVTGIEDSVLLVSVAKA